MGELTDLSSKSTPYLSKSVFENSLDSKRDNSLKLIYFVLLFKASIDVLVKFKLISKVIYDVCFKSIQSFSNFFKYQSLDCI